jgi:hypothetical protein
MTVDINLFVSKSTLNVAPMQMITPSNTEPFLIHGKYPRGFRVLTGGTLTVLIWNETTLEVAKLDLGTVSDGFEWSYGGFVGIAATDTNDDAITASNILALP